MNSTRKALLLAVIAAVSLISCGNYEAPKVIIKPVLKQPVVIVTPVYPTIPSGVKDELSRDL